LESEAKSEDDIVFHYALNPRLVKHTIVIVAGLGRFYGAGKRLIAQLQKLPRPVTLAFIDDQKLAQIAQEHGIPVTLFTPDIRGYGYWQWKPLLIFHFLMRGEASNIIYLDAGCDIDPLAFDLFLEWFSKSEHNLVLSTTGHNTTQYTKPAVIAALHSKKEYDPEKIAMLQATVLFLKTDSNIKEIFYQAVNITKRANYRLYDDTDDNDFETPIDFVDHRHDQAVLNLLILNSPYVHEVGVLPSSMTPPKHVNWSQRPPIIATRNSTSISLYWPLIKYNSIASFPAVLMYEVRLLNKIATKLNHPTLLVHFFNRLIELQFRGVRLRTNLNGFDDVKVLTPPVMMN